MNYKIVYAWPCPRTPHPPYTVELCVGRWLPTCLMSLDTPEEAAHRQAMRELADARLKVRLAEQRAQQVAEMRARWPLGPYR